MNLVLLAVGAAAVYLLQLLACRLLWQKKLTVALRFSEHRVRQGETAELRLTVRNGKVIPSLPVKVHVAVDRGLDFQSRENLAVSDRNYRSEVFSLSGREEVVRSVPLFCAKRGYYEIGKVDLIGTDLFSSRRFRSERILSDSISVLPGRCDAAKLLAVSRRITGETPVRQADMDDPFTLRGIRPYQVTDPIRDINWKASAKTGDLRVNVRDRTADQEILLILDTQWDTLLRPEELLEEGIRIAANLADEFAGGGIPTAIATNGKDVKTGEMFRLDSGADSRHAEAVRYGLSRIALDKKREQTMEPVLEDLAGRLSAKKGANLTAVLITSETGEEFNARWKAVSGLCVRSFRIQTAYAKEDVPESLRRTEGMILWEVPFGK